METELTKKMKKGLAGFKLEMPTNMRTPRFTEEVWTPTSTVDFIRFEDYKERDYSFCSLIDFDKLCENEKKTVFCFANGKVYKCKTEGGTFPNKHCKGCVYCKIIYYPDTNNCRIKKNVNLKKFHMNLKKDYFMTHSRNG